MYEKKDNGKIEEEIMKYEEKRKMRKRRKTKNDSSGKSYCYKKC